MNIEEGKQYKFDYPFVRCIYLEYGCDENNNPSSIEIPSWKPTTYKTVIRTGSSGYYDEDVDYENYADAHGTCVFTAISTHHPPGYPKRVFYTRKFITPDGVEFGKNKLLVTTTGVFKQRIRGYRYQYFIKDRGIDAAWKRHKKAIPF